MMPREALCARLLVALACLMPLLEGQETGVQGTQSRPAAAQGTANQTGSTQSGTASGRTGAGSPGNSGQSQSGATTDEAKKAKSCTIPDSAPMDNDHQLSFGAVPAVLVAGTEIDATISPELKGVQVTALCFDTVALPPPKDSTFK